jgi:hypothetical protein
MISGRTNKYEGQVQSRGVFFPGSVCVRPIKNVVCPLFFWSVPYFSFFFKKPDFHLDRIRDSLIVSISCCACIREGLIFLTLGIFDTFFSKKQVLIPNN